MTCKGICRGIMAEMVPGYHGTMEELALRFPGYSNCRHCRVYIICEGRRCPCCGFTLAKKSRKIRPRGGTGQAGGGNDG